MEGWRAPRRPIAPGAGRHDPSAALAVLIHGDAPSRARASSRRPSISRGFRATRRRHAAPYREQPGWVHDRPGRGSLDTVLERPCEGLRLTDRPRQRRRPRGRISAVRLAMAFRDVSPRRRCRSRRLPPVRSQRAGRAGVHTAADGAGHRRAPTVRESYATRWSPEGALHRGRASEMVTRSGRA